MLNRKEEDWNLILPSDLFLKLKESVLMGNWILYQDRACLYQRNIEIKFKKVFGIVISMHINSFYLTFSQSREILKTLQYFDEKQKKKRISTALERSIRSLDPWRTM